MRLQGSKSNAARHPLERSGVDPSCARVRCKSGRPWVSEESDGALTYRYIGEQFSFRRTLRLEGPKLLCDYEISAGTSGTKLPWMWSQHLLLATRHGERIVLDGVSDWAEFGKEPATTDVLGLEAGLVRKSYGKVTDRASVGIDGSDGGIRLEWCGAQVPYCGVWMAFGNWPTADKLLHQMALEPTTAPSDDLEGARLNGTERWLEAGQKEHWQIEIELLPPKKD
ncbi:hypothetical protein OU789_16000 [Halocynthiibacter sp. C4]|uniref:hypothetical protein n=1 Tax=Halocynthiibacter sp. C4 TaxID=2992758 RepID=UPI00237A2B8E|nr:hypothetical protein [Halocynthiibacter sp. C4]MDE0591441.1 hypothetical protein [Halocynthiibacter sp. C4]